MTNLDGSFAPDAGSDAPADRATTTGRGSWLRGRRWPGYLLIGAGVLVAAFAASYLVYGQVARGRLDRLDVSVPSDVRNGWFRPSGAGPADRSGPTPPGSLASGNTEQNPAASPVAVPAGAFYQVGSLYPASATNPKYWSAPLWAGTGPYGSPGLPEGFDFVSGYTAGRSVGSLAVATRIVIPAIGVDSAVSELEIRDLGDSRSYETPAHVVGHIPGTANPGENGNGWYFGHLESPFLGEGNVFYRLPEIAGLIKKDPVDILIESGSDAYIYRVVSTEVLPQDALSLYEEPAGTITLVACVPSRVYDHRLLVTAQLIAERR